MRALIFASVLLAAPAWAGNVNVIYYNGKTWDDRYGAPQHFTGEKSYRDSVTGQVQSSETYVNGALDGPFKHYDLKGVLEAAGSTLGDVLKTTVFLTDLGDFAAMNEVYARYFPTLPPARSTIEVSKLPAGASVEIECIAAGE